MNWNLPDGYIEWIWRTTPFELMGPFRGASRQGPHGECWANAWRYCQDDPDRFGYCEGVATTTVLPAGVMGVDDLGRGWTIRAGVAYPHAWVHDRFADRFLDPTVGWAQAHGRYHGAELEWERVDAMFGFLVDLGAPLCSFLETDHLFATKLQERSRR